jgi:hypothetical protein
MNNLSRRFVQLTLGGLLLLAHGTVADAAVVFTLGESVRLQYLAPNTSSVVQSSDATVIAGVEFVNFPDSNFGLNFDFSENVIDVTFNVDGQFQGSTAGVGGAQFNGFRIVDFNNTTAAFQSIDVGLTASTQFADAFTMGSARYISLNANEILIDFQGLSYSAGDTAQFYINGGPTAVPEPSAFAALGLLVGAVAVRRRRAAKAASTKVSPTPAA